MPEYLEKPVSHLPKMTSISQCDKTKNMAYLHSSTHYMTSTGPIIVSLASMFRPCFEVSLTTKSAEKAFWVATKNSLKVAMDEAQILVFMNQLHKMYSVIYNKNYLNVSVGSHFSHNDFQVGVLLAFLSIELPVIIFRVNICTCHHNIALTVPLAVFFGS